MERGIGQMKSWKASELTQLLGEIIREAGHTGVKKTRKICGIVTNEGKVLGVKYSYTDIQEGNDTLGCGSYERTGNEERKLRERVNTITNGMQSGFIPGNFKKNTKTLYKYKFCTIWANIYMQS